jgi:hypothetical protein
MVRPAAQYMDVFVIVVVVVVTALIFDFTNGFHDTANAMATRGRCAAQPAGVLGLVMRVQLAGRRCTARSARAALVPCSRPKVKPLPPSRRACAPSSRSTGRATTLSWWSPSRFCTGLSRLRNRRAGLPTAGSTLRPVQHRATVGSFVDCISAHVTDR